MSFIVLIFACYRLTHALAGDEPGPDGVFDTVRWYADQAGIGELVRCRWCLSVWVAGLLCLILRAEPSWWFIESAAVSGGSLLVWEVVEWLRATSFTNSPPNETELPD